MVLYLELETPFEIRALIYLFYDFVLLTQEIVGLLGNVLSSLIFNVVGGGKAQRS